MALRIATYLEQAPLWPNAGRHILAQFDSESVVVYQAYRPAIGRFAAEHGYFGGDFSLSRMSWIKPNFLWMMYRCGWGTKSDQEVVLAVRIKRSGFDEILRQAVPSIEDVSPFVSEQRANAARSRWPQLRMPEERIYPVGDVESARRLGLR